MFEPDLNFPAKHYSFNHGGLMDSHFWDIIRDIRSLIQKPDDALFILHTPLGAFTIVRFVYRSEARFVFVQGIDENGRERTAGFSEQQLSTFPFEIRTKPGGKDGRIRFNPYVAESVG